MSSGQNQEVIQILWPFIILQVFVSPALIQLVSKRVNRTLVVFSKLQLDTGVVVVIVWRSGRFRADPRKTRPTDACPVGWIDLLLFPR